MLAFVVTAGAMLCVALGFLLPPFLRRPRNVHASSQVAAGNLVEIYRNQMSAVESDLASGALAGTDAFDRRNYRRAVQFWERALTSAPPESEFSASLRASLNEARSLGGIPAASAVTGSGTSHPAADQVSGRTPCLPI